MSDLKIKKLCFKLLIILTALIIDKCENMSDLNDSEESRAFYGEKADEIKPSTVKQEEEPMI